MSVVPSLDEDLPISFSYDAYAKEVIPEGASQGQHEATKMAFFGGAFVAFSLCTDIVPTLDDGRAHALLERIRADLIAFTEAVFAEANKQDDRN